VDVRRLVAIAAVALAFLAGAIAPSVASAAGAPEQPEYLPPTPADFSISAEEAVEIANDHPKVAEQLERYGDLSTAVQVNDDNVWQVGYKHGDEEVVQVKVDPGTGAVIEAWTGYQVAWPMARGYEGQFGHILNAPYVWFPLALIFLIGLFDFRRPWRIAHVDLVVLLLFGVSHLFFNRGEIGVSVPLAYPVLAYLLARMLWLGFRGGDSLRPSLPVTWIGLAAVVLIAFRVTINIADSGVIDVGYAGAVGADKITHGEVLYGESAFPDDNRFGDTYGPANYLAYVPFELALPWSGEWDELASSHAAAIAFDLATVLGLAVFAMRLRPGRPGRDLAAILAFAWVAYPYTTFALQSNSNDSLVAALIVWSLALFAKPIARGAMLALAVMTKFAPLALVPLYATGFAGLRSPRSGLRPILAFGAAFAGVVALLLAWPAIDPGLGTFVDRTVVSQLDRTSPFSIWGQVDGIEWLQKGVLIATALFAALLAFLPRARDIAQVAALTAAVLIALQLSVDHWFYLYIPWFFGALLIALLCATPVRSTATTEG
jgi:hypothetical protein